MYPMHTTRPSLGRALVIVAAMTLMAACADTTPVAPRATPAAPSRSMHRADLPAEDNAELATLRRVTARFHDLSVATSADEGFQLLHDCETRLGDEPVGTVYFNPDRLLDGVIDPEHPDALIYEPGRDGGRPTLVGVEFAIPFALWTKPEPPTFQGVTFQREEEFGVFALHAWVWRQNPNGMFAETNPRVSCAS
jgi:hypothetical protein